MESCGFLVNLIFDVFFPEFQAFFFSRKIFIFKKFWIPYFSVYYFIYFSL